MPRRPRKPLLILHTGDAAPEIARRHGDFEEMFIRLGDVDRAKATVVYAARGEAPEAPDAYAGAVVAGSPFMVTDRLSWSENLAAWLRRAVDAGLPLLAVCYGHQLLAHALGGVVDYHPRGPELGTRTIRLSPAAAGHPLLADCPPAFPANLSHSQSVTRVPTGGRVLAGSDHDPNQIIGYGDHALSLQFHPEFDQAIMRAFIEQDVRDGLIGPETGMRLANEAMDTPEALAVLRRFVATVACKSML